MAPGRKPLDPDTKRERRRLSSALYEASNVDKRHEAAKLCMRRRRETIANSDYHTKRKYRARAAEHSEQYRARKLQEERVERSCASIVKRRERKHEADRLRVSHMQAPARKPQPRPGVQQPRKTLQRQLPPTQRLSPTVMTWTRRKAKATAPRRAPQFAALVRSTMLSSQAASILSGQRARDAGFMIARAAPACAKGLRSG
ncbi:hypothetical protein B0H14DRAFT_2616022 [Mycena olivaceomarginata]|nr:hypothetical protein B0H14DRAFT_2616022 [Mycena olivaceomarginata]